MEVSCSSFVFLYLEGLNHRFVCFVVAILNVFEAFSFSANVLRISSVLVKLWRDCFALKSALSGLGISL